MFAAVFKIDSRHDRSQHQHHNFRSRSSSVVLKNDFPFEIARGMDIFEGKNKRYCKRLTKFGRNIVLRIKPRAAMFVVRFAYLSLARYLTNPRVIAWLPALKGPLEPRLLTEILLFWASLSVIYSWANITCWLYLLFSLGRCPVFSLKSCQGLHLCHTLY